MRDVHLLSWCARSPGLALRAVFAFAVCAAPLALVVTAARCSTDAGVAALLLTMALMVVVPWRALRPTAPAVPDGVPQWLTIALIFVAAMIFLPASYVTFGGRAAADAGGVGVLLTFPIVALTLTSAGLVGGAIAQTFCDVVHRWRRAPSVGSLLDASAIAAAGLVALAGTLRLTADGGGAAAIRGVTALGGVAVAAAVLAIERHARRVVAAALAGSIPEHHVREGEHAAPEGLPSWSLQPGEPLVVLVTSSTGRAYRDHATFTPVAMVPSRLPWTWRMVVMPVAIAAALATLR
ncbi:MAG: hypothetical protein Q8S73_02885 [Deltaproteobacteria bacterium]|nr:hypothetical protein [Myxococcales bacterium]MDP3213024.1 hypothetical protein [Deltaproteobacteria bacterium]